MKKYLFISMLSVLFLVAGALVVPALAAPNPNASCLALCNGNPEAPCQADLSRGAQAECAPVKWGEHCPLAVCQ